MTWLGSRNYYATELNPGLLGLPSMLYFAVTVMMIEWLYFSFNNNKLSFMCHYCPGIIRMYIFVLGGVFSDK